MRLACATSALPVLAACSSLPGAEGIHIGFGAGTAQVSGTIDHENPDPYNRELDWATGPIGYVELGIDGLMLRTLGSREHPHVKGTVTQADVDQLLTFTMVSTTFQLAPGILARPMIGPGFGYVSIGVDPILGIHPGHQAAAGFAVGMELELAHKVTAGAMAWQLFAGWPGDTIAELTTGMIYIGLRF